MSRPNIDAIVAGAGGAQPVKHRGTSVERPTTGISDGFIYFDTTLGKPIWRYDSSWVDALGNGVDTEYQTKITGVAGNFAGFDAGGNLADSESKASDFEPAQE